jgi:hypothetical protein
MNFQWLFVFVVLAFVPESKAADFLADSEAPKIQSDAITEASGLAITSANPDFMWIINDSGGTPEIHLVSTEGAYCGKVTMKGTKNIDWEDLASFTLDGKNYLLVADTGDNNSKRKSVTLHIIKEPKLPEKGKTLDVTVPPAWEIEFQYEGGPRDCESVAVDSKGGKIILISKRTQPPEVYELPLGPPTKAGIQTAKLIGKTMVKSVDSIIPFRDQPVGLDITADNSLASVVTYYGVFLFPRQVNESWATAFSRAPTPLQPHLLGQAESIAFSKDGKTIYVVSEGNNSPIRRYKR